MILLDLETTGFSHKKDSIIEVSAFKLNRLKLVDEFHSFVKPQPLYIPPKITAINGITVEDVNESPLFKEIATDLWKFMRGNRIIGYNVLFDKRFLVEKDRRFSCFTYQDYLKYIKVKRPHLRSYTLASVSRYFGFKGTEAHRARSDNETLLQIIRVLGC